MVKGDFVMNRETGLRRYSRHVSWSACRWNMWAASHHIAVAAHRINRRYEIGNEHNVHLFLAAGRTWSMEGGEVKIHGLTHRHGRHASPLRKGRGWGPGLVGS